MIKTLTVSTLLLTVMLLSGCGENSALSQTGKAGSQARFAISGDSLYALTGSSMQLFDIQDPTEPTILNKIRVGFNIETLFANDDYLFIGAFDGVYIYDKSNREFPEFLSKFSHVESCDPVVVQGDYAYITLRGNATCFNGENRLDILDISDVRNPELLKTYPMQEPSGLGVDGNKLFVCDGRAGLKTMDITDPLTISSTNIESDVNCYDVIPNNGVLLVSDDSGLIQYDYTVEPMQFLSRITIESEEGEL